MNVAVTIQRPRPVELTADDFLLLKRAHAFAGYSKVELLQGKLSGVPLRGEDESDASVPIRLRVQDYLLLDAAGALDTLGRTELIDGVVFQMSPEFRPHMFVKDELAYRLRRALEDLGSALFVGSGGSVALSEHDMPRLDIILTSEPRGEGAVPLASIALLVEVADSTLAQDMGLKAALYAGAGVPEYWIVDVNGRVIHQMWSPGAEGYAERREVAFGERVLAARIDGLAVETAGL